ncbi:hypothetical protein GCM10028808_39100 [Spirosoma migulaei]
MGELTRTFDWAQTPLGTPDQWPTSLRTTLGIVLHSAFPMLLFWGPELICFYNDAFRPSLGIDGKHPAQGKRGAQLWAEIWTFIGPLIDQVMQTGEPVYFEDQLVPFYRNGHLEDIYWTFSYSPAYGDTGLINGVFVTCMETTEKVKTIHQLEESKNQFAFAIDSAELGTWELNPVTGAFTGNDRLKDWFGLSTNAEIPLSWAIAVMDEADRDRVATTIQRAMEYASGGHYDCTYTLIHPQTRQVRIVRAKGRAWFNEDQLPYRFNGTLQDVTEQARALQQLAESELQSRSLIEQSPIRTILMTGPEMRVARANEPVLRSWGKDATVLGKPLLEIIPQLKNQPFSRLLSEVYATGQAYSATDAPVILPREDGETTRYFDFTYQPMRTTAGQIYGVLSTAVDVTEKVRNRHKIEESEAKLRTVVANVPAALVLLVGRDLIVEMPSQNFIDLIDRGPHVTGRPLRDLLPELESQSYLRILDEVFTSGRPYQSYGAPVAITQADGSMPHKLFNLIFTPLVEAAGQVYAILSVATDVTEVVRSRQAIEIAQISLRNAIDIAELGTWSYSISTRQMTYSQRMLDWYGFAQPIVGIEAIIGRFADADQGRHQWLLNAEVDWPEGDLIDDEHTIINRRTGQRHIIHSVGKPILDDAGRVVRVDGTSREVTLERHMQQALESQVQQRTEELAVANDALAAINTELTLKNERLLTASNQIAQANRGLEEANRHLIRSNQNLEQFAYIASHDLQEPLRKIQQFGDLLRTRYGSPDGEESLYLERMQSAASRMSQLIKDLLAFSRISTRQAATDSVPLNRIVEQVLENLSVVIGETRAQFQVDPLPVVQGDASQMEQLFQNLLSNAIKFSRTDASGSRIPPQITIRFSSLPAHNLPASIQPAQAAATYQAIEVTDNGIGFEEKYTDRIFQVFQRLHGKHEFAGTGIGLAIVQKVVMNHGGAIGVSSQPGQGSTFCIYLPV